MSGLVDGAKKFGDYWVDLIVTTWYSDKLPGDGSLEANLAALPLVPIIGAGRAGAGSLAAIRTTYLQSVDDLVGIGQSARAAGTSTEQALSDRPSRCVRGCASLLAARRFALRSHRSATNVSNAGWAHVLERHFAGTGSRFSIAQAELRALLASKQVVGTPVARTLDSVDGTHFVRQLDVGYTIGVDKFSGSNTSILTVLTDEFGNLVTAFRGVLR